MRFLRRNLRRYKKPIFIVAFILLAGVLPLYKFSQFISTKVLIDPEYLPGEEVSVDYDLEIEIYENFFEPRDEKKFSKLIIENIENAQNEILIAIYSFNLEDIAEALVDASDRGVEVTLLYNFEKNLQLQDFLGDRIEKFNIIYFGEDKKEGEYYSMHHKFMIIDPGLDREVLFTGPWNWTYYQEDIDPNILVEIRDNEIIKSYVKEFYRLKAGHNGYRKFRDFSYIPWEKQIAYPNGEIVEIWWSPGRRENSVQNRMVDLIDKAELSVDVAVTLLDSSSIANSLLDKAREGVEVRIIIDELTVNSDDSIIPWMRNKIENENIDNITITEGGERASPENLLFSIFHFHNLIVDNKVVVVGTANWTYSGFFSNDENFLIIHSAEIAEKFTEILDVYVDNL